MKTLDVDETVLLSLPPSAGAARPAPPDPLEVTPLDSGHCAGSATFLFQGPGCGRVLCTGDWRREDWVLLPGCNDADAPTPADAPAGAPAGAHNLPEILTRAPLDALYLDNTYCHPRFRHPPRAATADAVAAVAAALHASGHRVAVGLDSLGKEELLERISAECGGCAVRVSAGRLAAAKAAGLPVSHLEPPPAASAAVADADALWRSGGDVLAVSKRQVSAESVARWSAAAGGTPAAAIVPTVPRCGPHGCADHPHAYPSAVTQHPA